MCSCVRMYMCMPLCEGQRLISDSLISYWDEVSLNLELTKQLGWLATMPLWSPWFCHTNDGIADVCQHAFLVHGFQRLNSGTQGCVESRLITKLSPWLACRFWALIRCASSKCSIPLCGRHSCSPGSTIMDENHSILTNPACLFLCSWSYLCALPKKSLLYPKSNKSSLVISEFFSFPLRSVVHFELIFVKDVSSVTSFIVLCMKIQLSQYHWQKKEPFSIAVLCSFPKSHKDDPS